MSYKFLILAILCFLTANLFAIEEKRELPTNWKESFSETRNSIRIQGQNISYKATAGNLIITDGQGKDLASMFFVSYEKEGVVNPSQRPITFCFNGGPGSAAVWLNIGCFGPRRLYWPEGSSAAPPYELTDNEESILDLTDLVFIDPVSTGHSISAPGLDPKQFHGMEEDVKTVAEFIRLYLSKFKRWDSPKYIAGESYGTTRAASLSFKLHEDMGIYLNGIILISSVLNFQTKNPSTGNDLPYLLFLPSYTAAAWYHKKLADGAQNEDLQKLLKRSEEFAFGDYANALLKGTSLDQGQKGKIAAELAYLTGLSPQYIERADLRIEPWRFSKELLRDEKRTLGRFDSRYKGLDPDTCGDSTSYDPSLSAVMGAFTGAFNEYLLNELKWPKTDQYYVLADVFPWDWGKTNQYVNVTDDLSKSILRNPNLKVFVASGYYDLAIPFYSTAYTFDHLGLDQNMGSHFFLNYYEGGHMMYLSKRPSVKLRADLETFFKKDFNR